MQWFCEKKKRVKWYRYECCENGFNNQHDAEQHFFRVHFGLGRVINETGTTTIYVPTGEEKEN